METKSGPPRKPRTFATFFMSLALGGLYAGSVAVYLNAAGARRSLTGAIVVMVVAGLTFGVPVGFACSPFVVM